MIEIGMMLGVIGSAGVIILLIYVIYKLRNDLKECEESHRQHHTKIEWREMP